MPQVIGKIERGTRESIVLSTGGLSFPLRGPGATAQRFRADIGSLKPEYVGARIVAQARTGKWQIEGRFRLWAWAPDRRATRAHIRYFIAEALKAKCNAAAFSDSWWAGRCLQYDWAARDTVELLTQSVRQIARAKLEYARHRAFMPGAYANWPGDKPAFDSWQALTDSPRSLI